MQEWEQITLDPDIWCGKTSPELSAATKARTSESCLKKLRELRIKPPLFLDLRGGRWSTSGCILADGWSIAWRVHDAQFWGVPQRRRRISLVADFGGESAPEILFERESVCGNTSESGETRENPSVGSESGTRKTGAGITYCIQGNCIDRADTAGCNGKGWTEDVSYTLNTIDRPAVAMFENHSQDSRYREFENGVCETVSAKYGTGGNNQPLIVACIGNGQADQTKLSDKVGALNCMHDQQAIMTAVDCRSCTENSRVNGTLQAKENGISLNYNNVCRVNSAVRRLTPLECERLQGFPDGWTDIGGWTDSKGKPRITSDAARYKALGNSIALPFWQWLADRIIANYTEPPTMASLFDGIGGFPLVFSRAGAIPVWASEIEPFPVAVTKRHFPEEGENND